MTKSNSTQKVFLIIAVFFFTVSLFAFYSSATPNTNNSVLGVQEESVSAQEPGESVTIKATTIPASEQEDNTMQKQTGPGFPAIEIPREVDSDDQDEPAANVSGEAEPAAESRDTPFVDNTQPEAEQEPESQPISSEPPTENQKEETGENPEGNGGYTPALECYSQGEQFYWNDNTETCEQLTDGDGRGQNNGQIDI